MLKADFCRNFNQLQPLRFIHLRINDFKGVHESSIVHNLF